MYVTAPSNGLYIKSFPSGPCSLVEKKVPADSHTRAQETQRKAHVVFHRASAAVMLDLDVRRDGGVRRCGRGMASAMVPTVRWDSGAA